MPEAPINVAGDGLVTSITFSTSPTSGFLHKGNLLAADFGQMRRVTRVSELLHNMWVLCLEGKRDLSTSKDSIWCVPLMTIKTKPFWPKLYRSKTSLSGNSISAFPPPKKNTAFCHPMPHLTSSEMQGSRSCWEPVEGMILQGRFAVPKSLPTRDVAMSFRSFSIHPGPKDHCSPASTKVTVLQ